MADVIQQSLQDGINSVGKSVMSGGADLSNVMTDAQRSAAIGAATAAQKDVEQNDAYINQHHGTKSNQPINGCANCKTSKEDKKYEGKATLGGDYKAVKGDLSLSGDMKVDQQVNQSGSYQTYSSNPNDYLYGNPSTTTYYNGMLQPGETTGTVKYGGSVGVGGSSVEGSVPYDVTVPAPNYSAPLG